MACPHLKHSIISKSKGGSIIASSAYNRREKMFDEEEHKMKYPHTKADDHVLTKMLLPDGTPSGYTDPSRIWNDLNKIEDDRTGYKLIIPFQKELSFEQNLELAIELLNEEYVKKGHPVQIDVHRGKNGNDHLHAIASDRRLVNGKWDNRKSETIYYKRGTVELDENGKVANPDTAVILTDNDKVDTPKLKRKKLQYDKDGNIIMEKGWQELQYDKDGNPLLDDKGYPVLLDIREPDYIPGIKEQKYSKNGKYLKPCWKKDTVKHSDVSDIGNIDRIRKTWERLQNEAYEKNNVLDENGKIFSVDLRSYKERNKDLPADQQLIPTRHVGYGMKSESMLIHNEEAKSHNDLVKELRQAAQALKAEQDKLARTEKRLSALHQDNVKFYAVLNPRQAFINSWTSRYNELVTRRKSFEDTVLQKLESGRKLNTSNRERINRRTKRGNASWNRLHRHSQLMGNMSDRILSVTDSTIDVATLAGKKFDTFSNKEIISFVRAWYGYEVSTVAADVLEQTQKDDSNAFSGREDKPPYFPKKNTNDFKLQQSIEVITKNPDITAVTEKAFSTWDKTPDEAPPKGVMNALDSYYTAEEFYNAELSGHKWKTVHLDRQYNPDVINRDYNTELKEITVQENTPVIRNALQLSIKQNLNNYDTMTPQKATAIQNIVLKPSLTRNFLDDYNAIMQAQATVAKEAQCKAEEARQNAWSREEYDRLSAITKAKFELWRQAATESREENLYQERLAAYDAYQEYKEIKNRMDFYKKEWSDQYDREEKAAEQKSSWSIFKYEANHTISDRYYNKYVEAKNELEERYPNKQYPAFANEPSRTTCRHEAISEFSSMRPEVLKKKMVSLHLTVDAKIIQDYETAADEARAYWKKKPTDPNDPNGGKNTQQKKTATRSQDADRSDRRKPKGNTL